MDVTEALRPWLVACWPPGAEKDAQDDGGLLKGRLEQARKFESLCASLPGDADHAQSSLGRLAVTKDAIIWDGMAHDEAHVQALVPGEHIDDLELSMDDRGHPFVLLILQIPHEDPVDLLLRATDGSSLEAHEVLEDLYNLVETVRASALDAMDDMPSARREAGSPGEESKRDRRASISLDAVTSLVAESEDHEQDETQDDNEAPVLAEASPAPPRNGATERTIASAETHIEMSAETESPSTPNKLEKSSSGDDLRARVRAFVRDPQGQQESLLEMLNSKYAYDLSCVPTPSRERVARSPARNTEPQKKYVRKLKPIVVDMQENSKKERADIERATNVKIKSPHGRSRKMQYIDQESLQVLSPSEYASRYLRYVQGDTSNPRSNTRANPSTRTSASRGDHRLDTASAKESSHEKMTTRAKVKAEVKTKKQDGAQQEAPTQEHLQSADQDMHLKKQQQHHQQQQRQRQQQDQGQDQGQGQGQADLSEARAVTQYTSPGSIEQALARAEADLHAKFERAMDEFIAEKKRILREHNVALHPVDANVLPAMQEDAKPKKQVRNPKSRSSRRKSISFDDMLDLFDDEDAENMPQTTSSARVMWSADGVSTSNTDAAGQQ